MGNVPDASRDTVCPECGEPVIRRHWMTATENLMKNGACTGCGAAIPGVFDHPPV
jgi:pyruvate formate lyase activating enzyme